MTTFPDLTIGVCTYKRPWYAMLTINCMKMLGYAGRIKFHISDGGSKPEDIEYYKLLTRNYETTFGLTSNLSDMCNSIAHHSGELFVIALDDFCLRRNLDITPDARLLLEHPEIGCVRFSRLAFFGNGGGADPETSADLVECGGVHWWRLDKARTKDSYACNIGFHLYHRRFWDDYGDIAACPPNNPGQAELNARYRYNDKPDGCTIAIPMRLGQDCAEYQEPIWHMGTWRTDEYAKFAKSRL